VIEQAIQPRCAAERDPGSRTTCVATSGREATNFTASNALGFAAAPTFAIMAMFSGLGGATRDALCAAAHDGSPWTGMAAMYLLMSVFHSTPWLKLLRQPAPAHVRAAVEPDR
jgi:hypothetical protein